MAAYFGDCVGNRDLGVMGIDLDQQVGPLTRQRLPRPVDDLQLEPLDIDLDKGNIPEIV